MSRAINQVAVVDGRAHSTTRPTAMRNSPPASGTRVPHVSAARVATRFMKAVTMVVGRNARPVPRDVRLRSSWKYRLRRKTRP
jgi:hypothetical protein